ncbi:hypothetical protein F5B22DRAFT_574250 [Xylaria bambusicola]|uniref:uncharacterized protein n=1 Tax=Xylaria bambusicola TaxID=326684 RepID=UPI002008AE9C|nr:uncharacterized protein F5B22DRAFT_574250 [Xylaria bambusicola]KAI0503103.1 hypothetical protein F5B22DRAFT_574250 [Xylaria bambusicola]
MRNFASALIASLPFTIAAPYGLSPRDTTPGCTAISFGDFAWTIEDFTYHAGYTFSTPAHQISSGTVAFNITNPAVSEKVSCTAYSTWLTDFFYGNINYDCEVPEGSGVGTSFSFSRPMNQLKVNQTWTCSDEDPQYPITFAGYGTANLTLDCKETYYQNPNWTLGQIYSVRDISCQPVTLPLTPHSKTAVA